MPGFRDHAIYRSGQGPGHQGRRPPALRAPAQACWPIPPARTLTRSRPSGRGRQVFLLKRAQIFAADVWGAFGGRGLGAFVDVDALTCFADYRVPVVLRELGVLRYSERLAQQASAAAQRGAACTAGGCRWGTAARAPSAWHPPDPCWGQEHDWGPAAAATAAAEQVDACRELPAGSAWEVEIRAACVAAVEALRRAVAAAHPGPAPPLSVALDWWLWEAGERECARHRPHHRTLTIYY
jgi:hypothetical protein